MLDFFRDTIEFTAVIYHDDGSMGSKAEGLPARIRVISPAYVKYTDDNSFTSNYTVKSISTDKVKLLFSNLLI